jgi:uncharacterized protein
MVVINVAQLLKADAGTVRQVDFRERLPDPSPDVHLLGPVRGYARLTLTSRGVLVQGRERASVALECARCLDEVRAQIDATFEEEFLPSTDVRSGMPVDADTEDLLAETPRINSHHEVDLDETLRQTILTNVPLRVLCDTACPGLCPECGLRLDDQHRPHPEAEIESADAQTSTPSPFARLSELLDADSHSPTENEETRPWSDSRRRK